VNYIAVRRIYPAVIEFVVVGMIEVFVDYIEGAVALVTVGMSVAEVVAHRFWANEVKVSMNHLLQVQLV
jgi:hypothetical protein